MIGNMITKRFHEVQFAKIVHWQFHRGYDGGYEMKKMVNFVQNLLFFIIIKKVVHKYLFEQLVQDPVLDLKK